MLELPPTNLFATLILISVVLLLPAALWLFTLFFFIFSLFRLCFPSCGGALEEEAVPVDADNDGNNNDNNNGDGDDGPAHLAALQQLLAMDNNNNNNGDDGDDGNNNNNNNNDHLTPAQRQMQAQGWLNT